MGLPRSLSGARLIKALADYGYEATRQTGSHIRLTTQVGGEHHVTVPRHEPLRVATLSAILDAVAKHHRITREQLCETLFP